MIIGMITLMAFPLIPIIIGIGATLLGVAVGGVFFDKKKTNWEC